MCESPSMGVANILCCIAKKLDKIIDLLECKCECSEDDDNGNGNGNGNENS